MSKYFTPNHKLADAITTYPILIQLLARFNISLGFGDKSIKCVCEEYNVPINFFISVCNIYAFDSYYPSSEDIAATDTLSLISYLVKSHIHYYDKRIPHIERHIKKITEQIDDKQGSILLNFFLRYKKEVREHFDYEENVIFPMLNDLTIDNISENSFSRYSEEHTDIKDTLDDLIQIVFKYLPGEIEHGNIVGMVFDILQLADDLKKHAMIEERILLPVIKYMERRNL